MMQILLFIVMALLLVVLFVVILMLQRVRDLKSDSDNMLEIKDLDRLEQKVAEENREARKEMTENAKNQRIELKDSFRDLEQRFDSYAMKISLGQKEGFESFERQLRERFSDWDKQQEKMLLATERKLEEMRNMVDEKLQKTLNERISQSFKLVSEQLESVQQGLGEMKNLANDVGGLKNALTNVKIRGNFGELQLKALLEQMLSPEQYEENVATIPNSTERVEFAIKLPGKDDHRNVVYLPIDSKFPKDVYDQYVEAMEQGNAGEVKNKSQQFETTVVKMAKDIQNKYVAVPYTTDFGILFVPVESLYAEILRRPKLMNDLRDLYHILVSGPTTLGALLSSLQMGFRTLAIQKHSSEVWKTLGAIKTEFSKFEGMLEKVQNNLKTACGQLDELKGTRTRAITRKLRDVEALPVDEAQKLLPLEE